MNEPGRDILTSFITGADVEPHLSDLVDAVAAGRKLDLTPAQPSTATGTVPSASDPPAAGISAALIRAILLGQPIPNPKEEGKSQVVPLTSAGIRIKGASVHGVLDLEDLSGPGGSALPGLSFHACWFENPIRLRRCHLRSLSLKECRITELHARGAVIDGPVNLSEMKRPRKARLKDCNQKDIESWGCWVDLAGSKIGGHVNCAQTSFAVTPRPEDTDHPFVQHSTLPRFALDLRSTLIQGSVTLRPRVEALGGISFNLARVQGSIWCNGIDLTAVEDTALSADYADIQGSLYLRAYDPKDGSESTLFRARGQVSLFAVKLGGSLYMEGAQLRRSGRIRTESRKMNESDSATEDDQSLDAANATIGGDCKLSCWQSVTDKRRVYPFEAEEGIDLDSASVRNDLILSGAKVDAVSAVNIEVGGECGMSVFAAPEISERHRMSAISIFLEGAVIKGDFRMLGAKIGNINADAKRRQGIFARSAQIGGNCHLTTYPHEDGDSETPIPFECYGRVWVQEASIGNSLLMAGARVVWNDPRPYAAVDISGTTIGGHAKFWTFQPAATGIYLRFEIQACLTGLRMSGTKIAQRLVLNGANITSVKTAIDAANIEVGGEASLSAYWDKRPGKHSEVLPFTTSGRVILTGATIKLGLAMLGAQLKAPAAGAPFEKAEAPDHFVALDLTLARLKFLQLSTLSAEPDPNGVARELHFCSDGDVVLEHAEVDTYLDLKRACFAGRFKADYVRIGASIEMQKTTFTAVSARVTFQNIQGTGLGEDLLGERVRDELARSHAGKLHPADLSFHSAKVGGALIVSALKITSTIDAALYPGIAPPVVAQLNCITADLRGLHIEELRDDGGRGWGPHLRLWMDGFVYARLTPVEQSPEISATRKFRPRWIRILTGPRRSIAAASRSDRGEVWEPRLRWLEQQYFEQQEPLKSEFTPSAYEQLVKTLNIDGLYEDARRIASAKLTQQTLVSSHLGRRMRWGLFGLLFDYGLSPTKASVTFVLCILLGFTAAHVANYGMPGWRSFGAVLYMNTSPPETLLVDEEHAAVSIHPIKGDTRDVHMAEVHCGERVRSLLYALDVFVPVLDLRQQTSCSISPEHPLWRYAQAAYAVLGWFLTPITLLTFSGILKRHTEK